MSWTNFPDKIYLINLAKRKDRLEQASEQLNRYNIPFERVEAIEDINGAEGLRMTMVNVFNEAIKNNYKQVLILEDDLDIIEESINEVMDEAVKDIPADYDIVYLGCQLCVVPDKFYGNNLIEVNHAYATHAAMYSIEAIKEIINKGIQSPIDNWIVANVQSRKKSYVVFPMLISQTISHSDIYTAKPLQNWKPYLEEKYYKQIEKMKEQGNFKQTIS